jgi:hypothetical protein
MLAHMPLFICHMPADAHRHHNVYEKDSWSARLNDTLGVFTHAASKQFMSELTGRDCTGETVGAPSWYKEVREHTSRDAGSCRLYDDTAMSFLTFIPPS